MEGQGRLEKLAAYAATITDLTVHRQYELLGGMGLQLTDTGWEQLPDPDIQHLVVVIPTRQESPATSEVEPVA